LQAEVISLLKDLRSGFIIAGRGHHSPASSKTSGQDLSLQVEVTSLLKVLKSGFIIAGRGHQPLQRPQVRIYHCKPRSPASSKTSGQDLSLQAEVTSLLKTSGQDLSLQAEVTSLLKDLRSGFIIAGRGHQPPERPQVRIYLSLQAEVTSLLKDLRSGFNYHCRPGIGIFLFFFFFFSWVFSWCLLRSERYLHPKFFKFFNFFSIFCFTF
jgi:hypothetical protein